MGESFNFNKLKFLWLLLFVGIAYVAKADPPLTTQISLAPVLNGAGSAHQTDLCDHFLASFAEAQRKLEGLSGQPEIVGQFRRLDPKDGTGYLTVDITPAVPEFLRGEGYKRFDWPASKAFAFEGDADVPHYIDMVQSREELKKVIGEKNSLQLQAFGLAMTDFVYDNLPAAERVRMKEQNLELILDLAELRVGVGTGSSIHLDWQPREGMVMIIPIYGNRTGVFDKGKVPDIKAERGHHYASLITGYERWANFHAYNCQGECRPGTFMPRIDGTPNGVVVPNGAKTFIKSRGTDIPPDMFPNAPGMLPTIHRAGEGPRMVIVLNLAYRRTGRQQPPQMLSEAASPERGSGIDVNLDSMLGPIYGADSPEVLELTGASEDGP